MHDIIGAVFYLKLDLVQGGVDTCQGDSGGPAVDYLLLPDSHDVRATLMGLVSWGWGLSTYLLILF